MIELTCQGCGETVQVRSLLTAAGRTCGRCGQPLLGPLDRGPRGPRPAGFDDPLPPGESGGVSVAGLWLGVIAGVVLGLAAVAAVAYPGASLPWPTRNAVLGALAGALLAPVLAVSSLLSMLILPFSLEGVLGDSVWSRLAKALHHRTARPLFLPLLLFVALPMALCGYGASRMKPTDPSLLVPAALGASLLGAILGGICGSLAGRMRRAA